jgi:hypothetical protein
VISTTLPSGGGGASEYDHSNTIPTAPSPVPKPDASFEMVDDVASINCEEDNMVIQVSQMEIPTAPRIAPVTMTPPHTPPKNETLPEHGENHGRLLSKLGGYGWRG